MTYTLAAFAPWSPDTGKPYVVFFEGVPATDDLETAKGMLHKPAVTATVELPAGIVTAGPEYREIS